MSYRHIATGTKHDLSSPFLLCRQRSCQPHRYLHSLCQDHDYCRELMGSR